MASVLKIENLKYKDILKDVSFSLIDKSFNILIGSNGSGKTTIVNAIRGLIKFDGDVSIFDRNIKQGNNFDIYKEVGFFLDEDIILEECAFNELLNILKNLDYEEEQAKKKIFDKAKKLNITQLLYKNPKKLFNYEKTLINFLFSIIHNPKLLIIDNDLETLDEKNKQKIFSYIKSQKKLTTLFVANNNEYFYNADNFIFLDEGKIVLECDINELVNNEKKLIKCGSKLPFMIDLSNKLISYELLNSIKTDMEELVNEIWK